jgi:hypothetical protein
MGVRPETEGWVLFFDGIDGLWTRGDYVLKDEGVRGFSVWQAVYGHEDFYLGDAVDLNEVNEMTAVA